MKLKLKNEDKNRLQELNKQFLAETFKATQVLYELLMDYAEDKLDEKRIDDIIAFEHECDQIKEQYIEILFKDKKALPFLVEDRYKIVIMIDHMTGKNEILARFLESIPFKLYADVQEPFKEIVQLYLEGVKELISCAKLMETDFTGAYKKTFEVENKRREAKNKKFDILEDLYKKKGDDLRIYVTTKLVSHIYKVLDAAEEISDYLRGLIIKYPSK
ncbi:MAG: DUF47 family protein [Candidatus Lokiarchaeota archaeon]|nr:DUF47 family protein [Candidatus Lokiarchaeota archaeon]